MSLVRAWILALMTLRHPLTHAAVDHAPPWARETVEQRQARYEAIAEAIEEVVFDPAEKPLFAGPEGRYRTAAVIVAIADMESGFRRDVDLGLGPRARGGGTDSCPMQIRLGKGQRTREGYAFEDLVGEGHRANCYRAGLHLVRLSYGSCARLAPEYRLTAYAAGNCHSEAGQEKSKARVLLARRLLARHMPPPAPAPEETPVTQNVLFYPYRLQCTYGLCRGEKLVEQAMSAGWSLGDVLPEDPTCPDLVCCPRCRRSQMRVVDAPTAPSPPEPRGFTRIPTR